jgi:hypothetical protein
MYGLISTAYSLSQRDKFEQLYLDSDSETQFLMRSSLAQALKDCPSIIPSHGTDWVLCTLTQYHKSEEDTIRVFQSVMRYLDKPISVGMLEIKQKEIKMKAASEMADSCMVGLGLFREYFEVLHRRRAAPSVDYYIKLGSVSFHKLGFDEIADDFIGWVDFLEREFTI